MFVNFAGTTLEDYVADGNSLISYQDVTKSSGHRANDHLPPPRVMRRRESPVRIIYRRLLEAASELTEGPYSQYSTSLSLDLGLHTLIDKGQSLESISSRVTPSLRKSCTRLNIIATSSPFGNASCR